jgi:hypothetical protein
MGVRGGVADGLWLSIGRNRPLLSCKTRAAG